MQIPQEPTIEQRVFALEAEVERLKQLMDLRDTGLLQRTDGILADLKVLQRDHRRGVETLASGQKELAVRLDALEETVATLVEIGKGNKGIVEDLARSNDERLATLEGGQRQTLERLATLEAGQQQIIELLQGKTRRND